MYICTAMYQRLYIFFVSISTSVFILVLVVGHGVDHLLDMCNNIELGFVEYHSFVFSGRTSDELFDIVHIYSVFSIDTAF